MSTAVIIVIVVVVIVLIGLLVALPRMRQRAQIRGRERRLDARRDQVVTSHREEAAQRERQAEGAEQRARGGEQGAQRGVADHELIADDERDEFAGTSAVPEDGVAGDAGRPANGTRDAGTPANGATAADDRTAERPRSR